MNSRNTQGEALFIKDTALYSAPHDTDPVPGSLAFEALQYPGIPGSLSNPQTLPPGSYQVAQITGNNVVDAGGGLFSGQTSRGSPTTTGTASQVKTPTLRQRGVLGMWVWIADQITSGGVSGAQINTILARLDDFATNPATGAPSDQRAIWAAAAAEIRTTALPAKDVGLAEEIEQRAYNQVVAIAQSAAKAEDDADADNVRVTGAKAECDDICRFACECMEDRGGAHTYTECVARKIRNEHYDEERGTHRDGSPRYPKSPTSDGPRPEVSYDPQDGYTPNLSNNVEGMPSSQYPVRGMPRPDISWWKDGKLWKLFELKFPTANGGVDGNTPMQASGEYQRIAEENGLDPDEDLIDIDVGRDCDCETKAAKPGRC